MIGAYNGTQGSVDRETSRQRRTASLDAVYREICRTGYAGLTWKEIAGRMDLHHGQASGALSNLHRLGRVFVMRDEKRDRCQIYIADRFRAGFHEWERLDEPAQTRSTRNKILMAEVLDSAWRAVETHGDPDAIRALRSALTKYGKDNQ